MVDSEENLVQRAQAGERSAYSALVERHWTHLCRWLFGLTRSIHLAEDLAQDTVLRAWSALPALRDARAFRAWLFRIAHNSWMHHKRGSRSRTTDPLADAGATVDLSAGPVDQAIDAEGYVALQNAIALLPEPYRAAYLLWSREQFPYDQIARILGISQVNARWRVSEARRLLVDKMGPFLDPNV